MLVLILCILAQLRCTVGAPPPPADVKLGLILEDFPLNFSALCKHLGLSALLYTAHSHLVGPCVINNPHRKPTEQPSRHFWPERKLWLRCLFRWWWVYTGDRLGRSRWWHKRETQLVRLCHLVGIRGIAMKRSLSWIASAHWAVAPDLQRNVIRGSSSWQSNVTAVSTLLPSSFSSAGFVERPLETELRAGERCVISSEIVHELTSSFIIEQKKQTNKQANE